MRCDMWSQTKLMCLYLTLTKMRSMRLGGSRLYIPLKRDLEKDAEVSLKNYIKEGGVANVCMDS